MCNISENIRYSSKAAFRGPSHKIAFLLGCALISTFLRLSEAATMEMDSNGVEENSIQQPEAASENGCEVHDNDSLHALMDRICELCHDMYSHQKPDMRANCRSNCFQNVSFKRCLRLFKPIGRTVSQRRKLGFMADALETMLLY